MLDRPHIAPGGLVAIPSVPLPIAGLVLGRRAEEAAELLPRIFNLCRAAQGMAVRLALGLKVDAEATADLTRDILRDHVLRLAVILPSRLGLPPVVFPRGGSGDPGAALFGARAFPATATAFDAFLESRRGIAPVLAEIAALFAPGEACAGLLPVPGRGSVLTVSAQENSVAARHLNHPVMRHVETTYGRGPLWRLTARALDIEACRNGALPPARLAAPGVALVPAARGLYAVRARVAAGRVAAFERVTPTDHLLAPGGIMAQSLASLPTPKHDLSGLLVDILDPCSPVDVKVQADA